MAYFLLLQENNIYDAYSDVDSDEERQTNYNLSATNLTSSTVKPNAPSSNWYEEGDATLNLNNYTADDIPGLTVQPFMLIPGNKSNTVTMTDVTRHHTAGGVVTPRAGSVPMTASCTQTCCTSQPQTVHRSSSFQPHSHV